MDWIKDNWKRVAKWSGLGLGCFVVAVLGFVLSRYIAAGSEYEGGLLDLAPTDVSVVMTVDNVPNRKGEFERFLDDLLMQPSLPRFENSGLWEDTGGEVVGDSLAEFRTETYEKGLASARDNADRVGIELFKDVLDGELVICTDKGPDKTDMLILTRVARGARFKWQFIDMASGFFPDEPNQPKFEYSGGILKITPPGEVEDAKAPETMYVTILDDVLVISNSERLMGGTIRLHANGEKGISADKTYRDTLALVAPELRERHFSGIWLNLDRMRERLPAEETDDGGLVSPVDAFGSLPTSVVSIYPDIFMPVNRIVTQNLDTRPFEAAYYGVDITEPSQVTFDQYLLAHPERINAPEFNHLRKTWSQPAAKETQLGLLPPDTMMQVSYRQPMNVLYNDVLDDDSRGSLVGDFVVALNQPGVMQHVPGDVSELLFAAVPTSYAPGASFPLAGTDFPLPGFVIAFRAPDADPVIARALLEEYLQVQRGRNSKDSDGERKQGPVQVIDLIISGQRVYGFQDPREEDNFIRRLNRSIRAAYIGEWLMLTNSEALITHTINARDGSAKGLAEAPGSPWRSLPEVGNATIYLNFDEFAEFASSPQLFKVLRDNKYNPTLIEGQDPGELRRSIARELGYDAGDTSSLTKPDVSNEYQRRKIAWEQKCRIEGDQYVSELQRDMNALRFFEDLALTTTFHPDHLHVRGILRIGD
ncbi:MAG: hypothetical protein K8I27_14670 [Planctomycetes bacterium]|nr:hypothetical protein [Planctomycetota bacterium]